MSHDVPPDVPESFEQLCLGLLHMVRLIDRNSECKLRHILKSKWAVVGSDPEEFEADIWIKTLVTKGIFETTIVECKYLTRRVNRDPVQKLADLARRVGATRAIIISKSGFSRSALQRAAEMGVMCVWIHNLPPDPNDFDKWLFKGIGKFELMEDPLHSTLYHVGMSKSDEILHGILRVGDIVDVDLGSIDILSNIFEYRIIVNCYSTLMRDVSHVSEARFLENGKAPNFLNVITSSNRYPSAMAYSGQRFHNPPNGGLESTWKFGPFYPN